MRLKNHLYLIPILIVSGFLVSCHSIKPGATRSGKSAYETFFVGDEGTQYYIKPILFTGSASDAKLMMDITFRYRDEIKDSSRINFTIEAPRIYRSVHTISFQNSSYLINSTEVELLFNEKTRDGYISRFTCNLPLEATKRVFSEDEVEIRINSENATNKFIAGKRSRKTIRSLIENIFSLMQ